MRGIAALIVVVHHSSFAVFNKGLFHYAFEAFFNAHAAVLIFFVLSGYVLTRGMIGSRISPATISRFYVARLFRIYPALWVASGFLSLYYLSGLAAVEAMSLSQWFQGVADADPWRRDYLLTPMGFSNKLLTSLWTITIELQASLVMPLIALAVRRGIVVWLVLQILFIAMTVFDVPVSVHVWPSGAFVYMTAFGAGAGLCLLAPKMRSMPLMLARYLGVFALITMLFFRLLSPDWRFLVDYTALIPMLV